RRRHTSFSRDWSSDVCSSDLTGDDPTARRPPGTAGRPSDRRRVNTRFHQRVHSRGTTVARRSRSRGNAVADSLRRVVEDMGKTVSHKLIEDHLVDGRMEPGAEIALRVDPTLT